MKKEEREEIRQNAATNHGGNLEAAACDFLDASAEYKTAKGVPVGMEASVGGIVWEIENTDDSLDPASAETTTVGKHVSKMNKAELLAEAERLGLTFSGDVSNKDLIAAIKAA